MSGSRQIGDALRALRIARGLTQEQVAALAGTTQRRVSVIESGREGARIVLLERIAAALGAHVALQSDSGIEERRPAA